MKQINLFINESLNKKDINAVYKRALEVIDYFNNEGVQGFDENDWKKYCKGQGEPNFKDFVNEMYFQMEEDDLSWEKGVIEIVHDYPDTEYKEEIENAIMKAAKKYIKGLPGA